MIASVLEIALLRIHCHATVVAHVLVTAGSHIEERGLSAVRIADKCDTDFLSSLVRESGHLPFDVGIL